MQSDPPRPSRGWLAAVAATVLLAVASIGAAVYVQDQATRPIGEGELFRGDAADAAATLAAMPGAQDEQLRRVRNSLEVEAVSMVHEDGTINASTSASLVGAGLESSFLDFVHGDQRFGAVAVSLAETVSIDGVEEWTAGSPLYAVIQPLGDGRSLLLHYDISELLGRREQSQGVTDQAFQLTGAAAAFLTLAAVLFYSRSRSIRHFRDIELETRLLREHAASLEATNAVIEEARRDAEAAKEEAEHAYALAEEKSRVRAEFVLMINHELRTPLTSVVTGAELLAADADLPDGDKAQIIDDMVFNGRRLQEIIGQMLAVARMENRGLTVTMAPQSAGELLELASSAHPGLEFGDGFHQLAGEVVMTDRATLSHLIASLADNALTHGATTVTIDVSRELDRMPQVGVGTTPKDPLFLTIADDGPGIKPAFLPQAFEKFEKDSFSSGTGLGLYAAHLMADAIGASLSISTSRLGTTLIIALPRTGRMAVSA